MADLNVAFPHKTRNFVVHHKTPVIGYLLRLSVRQLLPALVLTLVTFTQALAWGSEGHRVVAEIAEQYLEPAARGQVRELLAVENATSLAAISTWADQVRPQRRSTGPWHYVDIQIGDAKYDAARDCPGNNCLVAKIDELAKVLADRGAAPATRLEALKFLVHFVGDLHQPFHVADNHDRGGNEVIVTFNGRKTNLHAVWDTALLAPAVQGDERAYALALARSLTAADIKAWSSGSTVDWANDTHDVAVRTVYGSLPHGAGMLPPSYAAEALPIANQQLEKAGIRLAVILNATIRSP